MVWDEFSTSISKQTLSRELLAMDCRKLSARPRHHAKVADAIRTSEKRLAQMAAIGTALRAAHA